MQPEADLHSFLFADLVGYTALTETLGNDAAADLAVDFADEARMLAAEHGAEFIKAMGDAVMVHGCCAAQLVRLAIRLAHGRNATARRPPVRIGIHSGPAVARDGDWYGTAVNVAARLTDCACGGEVLITGSTGRRVGRDVACELVDQGWRRLRDVMTPVRVYAALPPSAIAAQPMLTVSAA